MKSFATEPETLSRRMVQMSRMLGRMLTGIVLLRMSYAWAMPPAGYTNLVALSPKHVESAPTRTGLDWLEFNISRHIPFSAQGELADISFPNWSALVLSLALPF